mmetsp:Transcript_951/g.2808  ORF Transcript_951/g.2808 Transcript_951/m.2808 type:complete len:218 (+) Transcript_951:1512-2165(+)
MNSSGSSGVPSSSTVTKLKLPETGWYRPPASSSTTDICGGNTRAGFDRIVKVACAASAASPPSPSLASPLVPLASPSFESSPLASLSTSIASGSPSFFFCSPLALAAAALAFDVVDSTAVSTLSLAFSFGSSVAGGYANLLGTAVDFSSIFGILRSLFRQMTAVGLMAMDRKCPSGNQNQNCEKTSVPTTACMRTWPLAVTMRVVTFWPPAFMMPCP